MYFKKEEKKNKSYQNALEISKANGKIGCVVKIGKIGCVVKTICELPFSLRYFTSNYQEFSIRI